MSKPQIDGTSLLIATLAAALALTVLPGPFAWLASIAGLVLILVLVGFDTDGYRSVLESLGYSAVFALCLTVASAAVWRYIAETQNRPPSFEGKVADHWLPLFWLGILVVFWPIDRARMSGRLPATLPSSSGSTFSLASAPLPRAPEPVPVFVPPPVAPPTPPPVPTPVFVPQPAAAQEAFTRPTFGQSTSPEAVAFSSPVPPTPTPLPPPPPPPPPVAPPPPVHVPAGPETTIYVNLVGEGLNVLRGVRAEFLGRDFYKIVDEMPAGETWQYGPGQVVRCKKRNLSSGKAMVAIEEAPRAN